MAKMLILEKNVNVATSDRDIINNMYKVRFEQNKFVVYDWDFKKTTKIFNFSMFVDIYKEFINSELRFEKFETARSDNEWVNVCMDLVKSGNIWLYLTDSNDILGFIILSKDNDTMIIHELAVSEISRGNGYGKQLLEFADILANDMHLNTLRVRVFDKNTVAKNMYISYGFHEIGSYDSETSNESLYSTENVEQIKRTGKYTYNNKKRVGGRRRFKCLDCGQRFHEFMQLYHHAEKFHKDLIGDEDVYRYLYEKRNPGPYICPICNKNPREWNDKTHKYRRICRSPECIKKAREKYSKNMKRVYGTDNLLTDPARQEEMLKNRSISGIYTFEDGVKISYVGKYEHDFIMHCVDKLGYGSMDVINCPSKLYLNYYDPYTQKNRFYMPDFYIPKYNLVIEIKDGSKFPRDSKAKAKLKEAAVIKANKFNYVKIVEKVYSDFDGLIEMFNNDAYAEKHFDKDFVFIIPEDTSK